MATSSSSSRASIRKWEFTTRPFDHPYERPVQHAPPDGGGGSAAGVQQSADGGESVSLVRPRRPMWNGLAGLVSATADRAVVQIESSAPGSAQSRKCATISGAMTNSAPQPVVATGPSCPTTSRCREGSSVCASAVTRTRPVFAAAGTPNGDGAVGLSQRSPLTLG